MPQNKVKLKEMTGIVVSDKMNKTLVVQVSRFAVHSEFKKTVKRFNKFKVADEKKSAKVGDMVRIRLTKPASKDKRWRLIEILGKAE